MAKTNGQLILEEDYDEHYEPTQEDLNEYATIVGIDPDKEPELMYIAKRGINLRLPEHWKPCQDPNGDIYYFNFITGESIWDHPCDRMIQKEVIEAREKSGNATSTQEQVPNPQDLTERFIRRLSREIHTDHFIDFFIELNFSTSEINTHFKNSNRNSVDAAHKLLVTWQQNKCDPKMTKCAKVNTLKDACKEIGLNGIEKKIDEWINQGI